MQKKLLLSEAFLMFEELPMRMIPSMWWFAQMLSWISD
jgi:hypothetical protein